LNIFFDVERAFETWIGMIVRLIRINDLKTGDFKIGKNPKKLRFMSTSCCMAKL
jgi:hypothetical protein